MPTIRAALSRFDSNLLITDMRTEKEQIDQDTYQERLILNLSAQFALLAPTLACVGIYGLLSDQVTRRTHEMGIRLALGAERADLLRVVLRQGVVLAIGRRPDWRCGSVGRNPLPAKLPVCRETVGSTYDGGRQCVVDRCGANSKFHFRAKSNAGRSHGLLRYR